MFFIICKNKKKKTVKIDNQDPQTSNPFIFPLIYPLNKTIFLTNFLKFTLKN